MWNRTIYLYMAFLAALLVVLPSCSDESPTSSERKQKEVNVDPVIVDWLKDNAIPFSTAEPGSGFDDLMPLKDMIGDARIVALGEATHGTSEFFKMKHRLLEFLVEEKGFTTFAIEATWPESNLVNDYIHRGEGNPAELLAGLHYWFWNTQEVLDMILWMRKNKVSFHGFDLQHPKMAIENVMSYVEKVDSTNYQIYELLYASILKYADHMLDYRLIQSEVIRDQLQLAHDMIEEREVDYVGRSSKRAFDYALQSARLVVQAEDAYSGRVDLVVVRDRYMAENTRWIIDQEGPDSKIVLWAHNFHVRDDAMAGYSMGTHLRDAYGDDMVIVGFNFYEGSFNAVSLDPPAGFGDVTEHTTQSPPEDAYSYRFRGADMPRMVLDLRVIDFDSTATEWIPGPRRFRSLGIAYSDANPEWYYESWGLPAEFDIIVYFESTTSSGLLPFPKSQTLLTP